ncbi:MAG TPA: preprotein translocase subunit YajC [Syntrophales bacterium]
MTSVAYAMGGLGGGQGAPGGDMGFILMMTTIFIIFYFLLIRPAQKKQKETKAMIANLKHGDVVETTGGIQGKVAAITEALITIEIAPNVKVKVNRGHITGIVQKPAEE